MGRWEPSAHRRRRSMRMRSPTPAPCCCARHGREILRVDKLGEGATRQVVGHPTEHRGHRLGDPRDSSGIVAGAHHVVRAFGQQSVVGCERLWAQRTPDVAPLRRGGRRHLLKHRGAPDSSRTHHALCPPDLRPCTLCSLEATALLVDDPTRETPEDLRPATVCPEGRRLAVRCCKTLGHRAGSGLPGDGIAEPRPAGFRNNLSRGCWTAARKPTTVLQPAESKH